MSAVCHARRFGPACFRTSDAHAWPRAERRASAVRQTGFDSLSSFGTSYVVISSKNPSGSEKKSSARPVVAELERDASCLKLGLR